MWLARGDLVQRFSRSAGRWQLVEAEPGAGKTRLMREAAGASVLVWLACRESERDDALAPLRRWWRQAAAELSGSPWWVEHGAMLATELAQCWSEGGSPPMADEEALRVDDSLGSPQDGSRSAGDRRRAGAPPVRPRGWMRSARWHRTLDLAARALIALAQRLGQPVAIDDLQWADGATLGLLRAMARLQASPSADAGPSVWLALRPHETEPALLRWLDSRRLEGLLDRHAMEGLSAAELLPWLGGDAEAARRLHRASGGNPFFAWRLLCWRGVEGLRACADEAATPSDAAPGRPGLPVELLGMVERRVAGLGDTARRVLAVAAVAGDARDVEALASLVSAVPWTVAGALAQAEAAGLLRGHEFVHDIVREAIVAGLPQARRTVLHTGIARRMAVLWPPERLAPHAWAAGDAEAAVEAVRLADERDRQRGAHQCAAGRARRWRRALRAANDTTAAALSDGLRARLEAVLACDLARTDFELGALERSRARLAEVFLSPTEPELRVEAWVLRAEIALHEGTVASAEAALAEARALHKPTAALWRMQATVAHLRGDYSSAERAFDRLVRHLRRGPPGAPLVQALTSLGAARDRALGPGTGLPLHEEAWSVAARLGARHLQVNAALNIVEAQQQQGRVDQALRWADAAMALGEFEATPALVNNLSAALLRAGRLDEARLWTQRLEHHARPALRCLARARLLRIAAAQGRAVEVAERAPALLSAMADTDDYAAQAAGVATLLEHAGTEHHPAALAFVKPLPLHAQVRTWLDLALAKRGHAQARFLGSDVSNERSSPECRVPTSTG
jgi:tetratricopeptide (TPR) repeat protein